MLKTVYLCAAIALLGACSDVDNPASISSDTPARANAGGWSIDPGGNLNAFFDCLEEEGSTLVSAHRGGAYPGFPENAVETIDHVLRAAPALIEVDVATSADGVLYLMHDDDVARTTNGEGAVNEIKWGDIKALRLEDKAGRATAFGPARFADALAFVKTRTIMQIDFKSSTRYGDVVNEVKRQGADDRVIYIAYSMASARKLHRLHPEAMISLSLNSQSELNSAVAAGVPADRLIGFTGVEEPRPRLFNLLNNRKVEVIFGTLGGRGSIDRTIERNGDESRYGDIARQGADIIATDRPIEAFEALKAAGHAAENGVCGVTRD